MNIRDQLVEIARRKERLSARAESQRAAIDANFRQLQGPIGVVDRGVEIAQYLRAHPILVGTVVAVVMAFRRRGLTSLAGRALSRVAHMAVRICVVGMTMAFARPDLPR